MEVQRKIKQFDVRSYCQGGGEFPFVFRVLLLLWRHGQEANCQKHLQLSLFAIGVAKEHETATFEITTLKLKKVMSADCSTPDLSALPPQIPCKHVFCYECALLHEKKGDKMCPG